jgi:hypothetical protein
MRGHFHIFIVALLLLGPRLGAAAEAQNFSGSYTLTGAKGDFDFSKDTVWTISVIQTGAAIEVTRVRDGHTNVNRFPLDGTEGDYTGPSGTPGKCKGQLKGKNLVLESVVTTFPARNRPGAETRTRERWELSANSKTLTIRNDVDFPGSSLEGLHVVEPWTEIYTRN